MKNRFVVAVVLAIAAASISFGGQQTQPQQPAQPPPPASQTPVAKQPAPKSPAEIQALQAIFQAPDADSRIKAAEEFLAKYADSEFKPLALMLEAETYRQKNDYEKMIIYGERTLEADPQNYMAMLMLAQGIAQRTREFDLDREEKLGRAEKYARTAMEILKTAPRPRPDITDEQWSEAKADFNAQAHEALALAAMARKKYDVAITEFNTALGVGSSPDPATLVRLGAVYNMAGKPDDAIATLNKVMAMPECPPMPQPGGPVCAHTQVKQFAQAERARAMQAKGATAKPAAPPASASPAPAPAPAPGTPAPAEPKKP